jgi:type VI protein secretion system component VasK
MARVIALLVLLVGLVLVGWTALVIARRHDRAVRRARRDDTLRERQLQWTLDDLDRQRERINRGLDRMHDERDQVLNEDPPPSGS